jgi:hypothetical protein
MKVNRKVERAVRKTLGAAVAGEFERFTAALLEITTTKNDLTSKALDLAIAIDTSALFSLHHGEPPDPRQLRRLVREFVASESWSQIDTDTVRTCLAALADQQSPLATLPTHEVLPAAFVIGGWLLSAFIPDGMEWTDFLDGVLDQLERGGDLLGSDRQPA